MSINYKIRRSTGRFVRLYLHLREHLLFDYGNRRRTKRERAQSTSPLVMTVPAETLKAAEYWSDKRRINSVLFRRESGLWSQNKSFYLSCNLSMASASIQSRSSLADGSLFFRRQEKASSTAPVIKSASASGASLVKKKCILCEESVCAVRNS